MVSVRRQEKVSGLHVPRMFTGDLETSEGYADPLDSVEYETRDAVIKGSGGAVFEMQDVEVPSDWSQLATDIIADKYFRKAGVSESGGSEKSAKQVIRRVSRAVRLSGERQGGYFAGSDEADAFEAELAYILIHQMAAFNSPVWFNCGLKEAYGITGDPAGNWCWDEVKQDVVLARDSYSRPQVSACFIQSIEDNLMDIAEHVKREMRIFKYGSGAGANFSSLRGRGEKLSGGGSSSGLMSFLEVFDRAAGAIKSGGTTRRAAKMVVVDVDHPDIEDFVTWKVREEEKARALIAAGYESDFNGEAYRTISGQNANNSVRVDDGFMVAVVEGRRHSTRARVDGSKLRDIPARELMGKIAKATWQCADPGMQYDTTINAWHTCPNSGRINASNPCSEFMYLDETACNLASLNLVKFYDGNTFNVERFEHACRVIFLAQEILVDHASYPTAPIARNSHEHRPLGIGYSNLGALLMRMGYPYDSEPGRQVAATITALMTGASYELSAEVAEVKGPFAAFAHNRDPMLAVMEQHRAHLVRLAGTPLPGVLGRAQEVWDNVIVKGREHGFRNSQASLLAPTGTISFLMDCDTTGVEPDYALVKEKKLAGGGMLKIVNQSVESALTRMCYPESARSNILSYIDKHYTVEGCDDLRPEHLPVFDCATQCGKGSRYIKPMGHIKMMEAVQPFLSGAISKTVNVPEHTTVDEVESLYMEGWKRGLKALALYRVNSKGCQVLTSSGSAAEKHQQHKPQRYRLPKKRGGFTQEAIVGGQKVYVRTGEYPDGTLGEVFIDMHKEGAAMRSMVNCFAIAISLGLQYGVPLEEYVQAFTFTNFAPNGPVRYHPNIKYSGSVIDYVFRMLGVEYLGRYDFAQVQPEELDGERVVMEEVVETTEVTAVLVADAHVCDVCGNLTTRKNGTCYVCENCGTQTGCA